MTFGSNAQNGPTIYESTNGLNWSPAYTSSHLLSAAAYGNNTWVFIGQNGNTDIVTATMGSTNWNWSEYQPSYGTCCITYANGLFVLLMDSAPIEYIYTSPDGIVWQFVGTFPGTPGLNGQISYGNGVFVATDQVYNNIYTSSNLIQWATNTPYSAMIAFGGNWFLSSAFNSSTMSSSSNGYSWSTTSASYFSMIAYGQGTFIGCSNRNVYQSGVVAATSNPPPANLSIATYAGITVNGTPGLAYQIQYNTKLNTNWMTLTNFSLPYSPYLWIDTSTTVTGQRFYRSVQIQ